MAPKEWLHKLIVRPGTPVSLAKDRDPGYTPDNLSRGEAEERLAEAVEELAGYQDKLYAQNQYALLIVLQAMDASGKDSIVKHVMSGVNPTGFQVYSFKAPSAEEQDHDYLWRCVKALPERGRIGVFNRSYYEEVLVVRVHPEILAAEQLPLSLKDGGIWQRRFEEINAFEKYLTDNGTAVLKFFLHMSKEEQKKQFFERLDDPTKHWKFATADVEERGYWDEYMHCYEEVFKHTSTEWAPWYVVPADHKWFTRLAVAEIIIDTLRSLKLAYPAVTDEQKRAMAEARRILEEK